MDHEPECYGDEPIEDCGLCHVIRSAYRRGKLEAVREFVDYIKFLDIVDNPLDF